MAHRSQIILGAADEIMAPNFTRKQLSVGLETAVREVKRTTFHLDRDIDAQHNYKAQLDADKEKVMISSRKPLQRQISYYSSGFNIGNQSDQAQLKTQRIENAKKYQADLDKDLAANIKMTRTVKMAAASMMSVDHPESIENDPYTFSTSQTTDRAQSKVIQAYLKTSVNLSPEKPRRKVIVDNEPMTFLIGGNEEALKKKKGEMRDLYRTKLSEDQTYFKKTITKDRSMEREKLQRSTLGWTGFDVGGCASNTRNAQDDFLLKRDNQDEYARLLATQIQAEEERKNEEKLWKLETSELTAKVPYMSN